MIMLGFRFRERYTKYLFLIASLVSTRYYAISLPVLRRFVMSHRTCLSFFWPVFNLAATATLGCSCAVIVPSVITPGIIHGAPTLT